MSSIAFLGLGRMGAPMARRVLAAGYDLTVWNRTPGRAEPLLADGAKAAPTPAEAASDSSSGGGDHGQEQVCRLAPAGP